jgi:hypothetical protein
MHRPVEVAHSLFIEGSHTIKNTASVNHPNEIMAGNIKGGSITVWLTSCLSGLD